MPGITWKARTCSAVPVSYTALLIAQRGVEHTRYLAGPAPAPRGRPVADVLRLVKRSVFLAGDDILMDFDVSDAANRQRWSPPREDDRFI